VNQGGSNRKLLLGRPSLTKKNNNIEKRERNTSSWLKAQDKTSLVLKRWLPARLPKKVALIVHGMSEHIDRYDEFAK
jgi:alpha-beta hydrolase superfamily lysophospholipase